MTIWAPAQTATVASTILEIHGALRLPLNCDLREQVEGVLRDGPSRILLDLSAVPAIDAAGIGELIHVYNATTATGGVLRIIRVPARVRRVLEIVGVFGLLTASPARSVGY
jgi:anti-sigma B factor antagonist